MQSFLFTPEFKADWSLDDKRLVKAHQLESLERWIAETPELFFDYESDDLKTPPFMVGFYAPDKGAKIVDFRLVGDAGKHAVASGLARRTGRTISFNLTHEWEASRRDMGFTPGGTPYDPMHAAFAVNELRRDHKEFGPFSQKALIYHELGVEPIYAAAVQAWLANHMGGPDNGGWSLIPASLMFHYNCEDVELGWRLYKKLDEQVVRNRQTELVKVDSYLCDVVERLQRRGIQFDCERAADLTKEYAGIAKEAHHAAREALGYDVDYGSHTKVYGLLYGTFGLPRHEDIEKSGGVDKDVIAWMLKAVELKEAQRKVLEAYQTISEMDRLRGGFLLPWQFEWQQDSIIYPRLNMRGARTRRFSANDPNLQNVPARTDYGAALRSCFVSRPGWTTYSVDQSQAEYRAFTHYASPPELLRGYRDTPDFDIHVTVSEWLGVKRKDGKHLNFAQLYGVGKDKLARQLLRSKAEAEKLLNYYHSRIPEINRHKAELKQFIKLHGYVTDMFGGRRHLTADEAYKAINSECQMTVANLIRRNMVDVDALITPYGGNTLLQVHDEVIFELPGEDYREHLPLLRRVKYEAMERNPGGQSRVPWKSDMERFAPTEGQPRPCWQGAVAVEGL